MPCLSSAFHIRGLTDAKIHELANVVIAKMINGKCTSQVSILYTIVIIICLTGFITDGEWNSLRTKGNLGPLSIFQVRADARAKFGITKTTITITLKGMH